MDQFVMFLLRKTIFEIVFVINCAIFLIKVKLLLTIDFSLRFILLIQLISFELISFVNFSIFIFKRRV